MLIFMVYQVAQNSMNLFGLASFVYTSIEFKTYENHKAVYIYKYHKYQ